MSEEHSEQLARVGRALAHPLRVEILAVLLAHEEASPSAISRELSESPANVSYHVRYLRDLGVLECRRELERRGAIEHVYAITPDLRGVLLALCTAGVETMRLEEGWEAPPPS